MRGEAGPRAYDLQLGLGPVPASVAEVLVELGDRLDHLTPRLVEDDAGLRLSLTVPAADLWLAALIAMAAVSGAGYPVESLHAGLSAGQGAPSEPA